MYCYGTLIKKIFFAVIYRNPCDKVDSPEFTEFLDKFENFHLQIKRENPYTVITVGDFNGHCQQWYPEGDSNKEGIAIESLTSKLGLSQLISQPTNFQDNSAP